MQCEQEAEFSEHKDAVKKIVRDTSTVNGKKVSDAGLDTQVCAAAVSSCRQDRV